MLSPINDAISSLHDGRSVLLFDDIGDTPSSYLIQGAKHITPADITFFINHARGVICAALTEDRIRDLGLPLMTSLTFTGAPNLTVSVEARQGVTTGISAADRARTLSTLATSLDAKMDLVMPGHIFPVLAKDGGVLVRHGIPEASIDLLRLSNSSLVAAFSHCLNAVGELASFEEISVLAKAYSLPLVSVSDIIRYRLATEQIIEHIAEAELPTEVAGRFRAHVFRSKIDGSEHLALVKGNISPITVADQQLPILVRVHSEHRLGDLLNTPDLGSRKVMLGSLKRIEQEGRGVFVYIRHPKQGVLEEELGILSKKRPNRESANLRELGVGAQILCALGVSKIRLLSNSTREIKGVEAFQLQICERVGFELYNDSQT